MNEEDSPAFLTAKEGYDVWLGNNRGNTYSTENTNNMTNDEYYNYSYYELGKYDAPAQIDFVLNKTN